MIRDRNIAADAAIQGSKIADMLEMVREYSESDSHQGIAVDLTLDAGAGSTDGSDPSYLAAAMFNLLGADMTAGQDANYLGGVIGAYSITGTKRTSYPSGAVLAQITDGVTQVAGAVVAYIDGDSSVTTAGAAFKVMTNNSNAASGFDFGLDLQDATHDGYAAVDKDFYLKAPLRLVTDVVFLVGAGAPVDGTTGDNVAGKSSLYFDTTNGFVYINTGTITDGTWVKVGTQS